MTAMVTRLVKQILGEAEEYISISIEKEQESGFCTQVILILLTVINVPTPQVYTVEDWQIAAYKYLPLRYEHTYPQRQCCGAVPFWPVSGLQLVKMAAPALALAL